MGKKNFLHPLLWSLSVLSGLCFNDCPALDSKVSTIVMVKTFLTPSFAENDYEKLCWSVMSHDLVIIEYILSHWMCLVIVKVFSLGVFQHMHKINLWKFGLNWSLRLKENNDRKKHSCKFLMHNEMLRLKSFIFEWEITSFS